MSNFSVSSIHSTTHNLPNPIIRKPARSNVPIRIGGSRGRTGCTTCKKRHVKCDEHKPACKNCSRLGRTCDYQSSPAAALVVRKAATVCSTDPISHYTTWSDDDLRAMQFFYCVTTKQLGGPFSDELWSRIIPLAAQHEPAVQAAIVAVGAFHSQFSYNARLEGKALISAIQNYIKALHQVTTLNLSSTNAIDTSLIICLLVVVLESLQGHLRATLFHVKSGNKLLLESKSKQRANNHIKFPGVNDLSIAASHNTHVNDEMDSVLLWLDALSIHEGDVTNRSGPTKSYKPNLPTIPGIFSSFKEAHRCFIKLFSVCSHYCQWLCPTEPSSSSPYIVEQAQAIQRCLTDWKSSFDQSPLPHRSAEGLILLVHATHMNIITDFYQTTQYETDWDRGIRLFVRLVEYAEEWMEVTDPVKIDVKIHQLPGQDDGISCAVESPAASSITIESDLSTLHTSYTPRNPTITLAMSIVTPIHFTAQRCRDPIIRRRALAILSACNIREGIFDSNSIAMIVRRVVELEEIDALAMSLLEGGGPIVEAWQIREESRVREIDVDFGSDGNGHGTLKYKRGNQRDGGMIESFEEVLRW